MNNATIERIEIKMRGDNVYDIYVNKKFIGNAVEVGMSRVLCEALSATLYKHRAVV